jgi:hypothetical protein
MIINTYEILHETLIETDLRATNYMVKKNYGTKPIFNYNPRA